METIIEGTYGSNKTPCNIFVYQMRNGLTWYCVDGSKMCNATYEEVTDGVDVEELSDVDCFTWSEPITDINMFINAVEEA